MRSYYLARPERECETTRKRTLKGLATRLIREICSRRSHFWAFEPRDLYLRNATSTLNRCAPAHAE
jgi:hypothetical protein